MGFIIDKQTLSDLRIFEKDGGRSVFSLYNSMRTRGGSQVLEDIFNFPLSDADKINNRSSVIKFFHETNIVFPYRNEDFDSIEHYLANSDSRSKLSVENNTISRRIKGYVGGDAEFEQIHKGVISSINIINITYDLLSSLSKFGHNSYSVEAKNIFKLLDTPLLSWVAEQKGVTKLSYEQTAKYDSILRYEVIAILKKLLYHIYNLDVYISLADIAKRNNFVFGVAHPISNNNVIDIKELIYPLLPTAKPNSIYIDSDKNIVFLTGANMAGKSTFMKAFGAAIYLAHIGVPLPVKSMEFTVQNGLYTTINLPDNMSMGYSHFYNEVLRLKKVAYQISNYENIVIIFDELFRGTNVKDAHEATVEVTKAFSKRNKCTFMISTHIIEAGEDLASECDKINFVYMPTIMKDGEAIYTYTLTQGITSDRHGMMIIRQERILDILKKNRKV